MHQFSKLWIAAPAAGLALTVALLLAVGLTGSPRAQEGADIALAALDAKIVALEARVKELEDQKDQPLKAPFVVVDGSKNEILRVDGVGGAARLRLGGSSGGHSELTANQAGGLLRLVAGGKEIGIGFAPHLSGFYAGANSTVTASFADLNNGKYTLLVRGPGGGPVLQAGYNVSGKSAIIVGDGEGPVARLEQGDSGKSGRLKLYDGNQEIVVLGRLDEARTGLQVKADSDIVFTGKSSDGPQLSITQGSDEMFSVKPESGGMKLGIGTKENNIKLHAFPKVAAVVTHMNTVEVVLGTNRAGTNGMVALKGDRLAMSLAFDSADGKPFMGIYGSGEQSSVFAGIPKSGRPTFRISSEDGAKDLALIEASEGGSGQAKFFGKGGEEIANISPLGGDGNEGTFTLSSSGKPSITLGPTKDKPRAAVRIYNKGEMVYAAGVGANGAGIGGVIYKDMVIAGAHGDGSGNGNVFVGGADDKVVASINAMDDPGKGLVNIYRNGITIAHMGVASSGGGNFTAADPAGQGVFSAGYLPDGPGGACVANKGTKCLGVALTGLEGFH